MNLQEQRLMKVLLSPHVSEKSTRCADDHGQVVFRVMPDATKPEVKAAVEKLFKVDVEGVQIVHMKGKRKSFSRISGRRSDWKKAYVKLKAGQDIDFLGGE